MTDIVVRYEYEAPKFDSLLIDYTLSVYQINEFIKADYFWESIKLMDEKTDTLRRTEILIYLTDRIDKEKNIFRVKDLIATKCMGLTYQDYLYKKEELNEFKAFFNDEEKAIINGLESVFSKESIKSMEEPYKELPENIYEQFKQIDYKLSKLYHKSIVDACKTGESSSSRIDSNIEFKNVDPNNFFLIISVLTETDLVVNQIQLTLAQYLDEFLKQETTGKPYFPASIINQEFVGMLTAREKKVIFGYINIPMMSVINLNPGDLYGLQNPLFKFNYKPDKFIKYTHYQYNEINIKATNPQNKKIMPSFVLAFDRVMDADRLAAERLNIPIYVVNTEIALSKRKNRATQLLELIKIEENNFEKLSKMIDLYRYQEQTTMINNGAFKGYEEGHKAERDITLQQLSILVDEINQPLVYNEIATLQENIDTLGILIKLCWEIRNINYFNTVCQREINYSPSSYLDKEQILDSKQRFLDMLSIKIEDKLHNQPTIMDLIEIQSLKVKEELSIQEQIENYKIEAIEILDDSNIKNLDIFKLLYSINIKDWENIKIYEKENERTIFHNNIPIYYHNEKFKKLDKATSLFSLAKQQAIYTTEDMSYEVTFTKTGACIIAKEQVNLDEIQSEQNQVVSIVPKVEIISFDTEF